ncbi:hypothetical protein [Sinorhizobium meliloti]|uniref:hypothetical protein n=1 Tax=Rhizobium meliloti TaxID=382 RepID=UPI00192D535C|nr:hypothetical protein [Sinorhizobium meliloti]
MSHFILVTLHLFAAILFAGTVFFEVLVLEGIRKRVGSDVMRTMEAAIGWRARRLMPFVIMVLYTAGITMAWQFAMTSPGLSKAVSQCCFRSRSHLRSAFWCTSSRP